MKFFASLAMFLFLIANMGYTQTTHSYFYSGNEKHRDGDNEGAYLDYTRAIELSPNIASIYYNRALTLADLGRSQEAIQDFSKVLQLRLIPPDIFYDRGLSFQKLGRYQEAIQDYSRAIRIKPKDNKAYNNRGVCFHRLGQNQEAIRDYSRAIQINPRDDSAFNNRGTAFRSLGRYQEAIRDYSRSLQIKPDYYQGFLNRGLAFEDNNNFEEAAKDFREALQINPNYDRAKYSLARIENKIKQKRTPKTWLVAVGIDNYQYSTIKDLSLSPLQWSVTNVNRFRNEFLENKISEREQIEVLHNIKATKEDILNEIENSLCDPQKVYPEDKVVFYFVGHGIALGESFGICPYDYHHISKVISVDEIVNALNNSPALHRFCLIESCKSANDNQGEKLSMNLVQKYASTTAVFTSTKQGEASIEDVNIGGYFSHYLMLGIRGQANGYKSNNSDNYISTRELYDFIKDNVLRDSKGIQEPQINPSAYQVDIPFIEY